MHVINHKADLWPHRSTRILPVESTAVALCCMVSGLSCTFAAQGLAEALVGVDEGPACIVGLERGRCTL